MTNDIDQQLRAWARAEHAHTAATARPPDLRTVIASDSTDGSPPPPDDELLKRRKRRRLVLGLSATAVIVAAGGTAAATTLLGSKAVTDHDTARCYRTTSQSLGDDYVGDTIAEATPSGHGGQVRAPIAACAVGWHYGVIQGYPPNTGKTYPVPPLVGCVLSNGTAAVFPGSAATCHKLGLPNALPG